MLRKLSCAYSLESQLLLTQLIEWSLALSEGLALQAETLAMYSQAPASLNRVLTWGVRQGIQQFGLCGWLG
jgi:hypothetical protein